MTQRRWMLLHDAAYTLMTVLLLTVLIAWATGDIRADDDRVRHAVDAAGYRSVILDGAEPFACDSFRDVATIHRARG